MKKFEKVLRNFKDLEKTLQKFEEVRKSLQKSVKRLEKSQIIVEKL